MGIRFLAGALSESFFQAPPPGLYGWGVFSPRLEILFLRGALSESVFPEAPPGLYGWVFWPRLEIRFLVGALGESVFPDAPLVYMVGLFLASLGNSISGRRAERVSFSRRPPGLYGWGVCSLFWACAVCPGGLGFADAAHSFAVPFGLAC